MSGGGATGGGFAFGGFALGGVAVKAAAVVTAVSVAGSVGYVGTKEVRHHRAPATRTPVTAVAPSQAKPRPASAGGAQRSAAATAKGKALAKGSARATSPTGSSRGKTAPGRVGKVSAKLTHSKAVTTKPTHPAKSAKTAAKPRPTKPGVVRSNQGQAKPAPRPVKAPQKKNPVAVTPKPKVVPATKHVEPATTKARPASATSPKGGNGKKP